MELLIYLTLMEVVTFIGMLYFKSKYETKDIEFKRFLLIIIFIPLIGLITIVPLLAYIELENKIKQNELYKSGYEDGAREQRNHTQKRFEELGNAIKIKRNTKD